MLFNSLEFAFFLPIVFILYWFVTAKNLKFQNVLLLISSYIFYGWWDWRFLSLIIFSSFIDYFIGLALSKSINSRKRKHLLWISICVNLGILGIFKYYNFFVDSFADAFSLFGQSINPDRLQLILPIGISFYTFQTLSYTLDVYKEKLKPTRDIVAFFCFVGFFPQLVAGPIERAKNLLPQFYKKRVFSYPKAVDGLRQMLWGFFKKMVIADACADYVNTIFQNPEVYSGSTLFLGAILFAFQIYCDFSGYSDIAIGTARLFGFNFKQNFAFPYFSRDIAEFWRRWHISLSTWFRDYLYIPLGGSRGSRWLNIRNIFIVFIISGFWHGANYTFLIWGALNALFFVPLMLLKRNRKHLEIVSIGNVFPKINELISIVGTFCLTTLTWVFFRAENLNSALIYLKGIFSLSLFETPGFLDEEKMVLVIVFILVLLVIEWIGRAQKHALELFGSKWPQVIRLGFYYTLVMLIFLFGAREQAFIYFQF